MPFNPEANQEAEDANLSNLRKLEQQLLWQISDAVKTGAADEVRDLQKRLTEVQEEIKQWKDNRQQSETEAGPEENSEKIARQELKNMRGIIGMDNTDNDHS